jgi:hypothetical protein
MALLGEALSGSFITISNTQINGKKFEDFDNIKKDSPYKYKWFNRSEVKTKVIDLLKEIIPEKASKTDFIDIPLDREEILNIKNVFEKEIEKLLIKRKTVDGGFIRNIFGNDVLIDIRKNGIIDHLLIGYNGIYEIAKECLEKNKPVYLSID